jgi:hypothetical protein
LTPWIDLAAGKADHHATIVIDAGGGVLFDRAVRNDDRRSSGC